MTIPVDQQAKKPRGALRFRLSTLILSAMLLFVIAGCLYERSVLQSKHEMQLERSNGIKENIGYALGMAHAYNRVDTASPKRLQELRHINLTTAIWLLSKTETYGDSNDKEVSLRLAKASLDLLDCSNMEQLRTLVANAPYYGPPGPFTDPKNQEYDRLEDFVSRASQWTP